MMEPIPSLGYTRHVEPDHEVQRPYTLEDLSCKLN
jgi:hypothetical protein